MFFFKLCMSYYQDSSDFDLNVKFVYLTTMREFAINSLAQTTRILIHFCSDLVYSINLYYIQEAIYQFWPHDYITDVTTKQQLNNPYYCCSSVITDNDQS